MGGSIKANELLRAGIAAYGKGDHRLAHNLWRESAALRPHNEQVWLALLSVVDNDDDRRVCLENILNINPDNAQAREQLKVIAARQRHRKADDKPETANLPTPTLPLGETLGFGGRLLLALRNILHAIIAVLIVVLLFVLGLFVGVTFQLIQL